MGSMGSSSVSASSSSHPRHAEKQAAAFAVARSAFLLLTGRRGADQGQGAAQRTAAAAGAPQYCNTGVHITAQDGIQCHGPSGGQSGSGGHHGSASPLRRAAMAAGRSTSEDNHEGLGAKALTGQCSTKVLPLESAPSNGGATAGRQGVPTQEHTTVMCQR